MRALSLFSGIGGLDLAAEWAGFETVAFCENADFPRKVLKKHWPDVPIFKDVKQLDRDQLESEGIDVGAIDIIFGGFPCQPYSTAGKQRGKEDDRDLWPEMFRIIREIKPSWVVGENVANFVNMELERTLINLESEGYETQAFIIPAASVDAKHNRNRTFIVAHASCERHIFGKSEKFTTEIGQQAFSNTAACGEIMAHTESDSSRGLSIRKKAEEPRFERCREDVAHTGGERCGQMEQHDRRGAEGKEAVRSSWERRIQCGGGTSWWKPEPRVGRVANGIPYRVDRLKGLGNAVVPQQAFPIFAMIMEIERMMRAEKNTKLPRE